MLSASRTCKWLISQAMDKSYHGDHGIVHLEGGHRNSTTICSIFLLTGATYWGNIAF